MNIQICRNIDVTVLLSDAQNNVSTTFPPAEYQKKEEFIHSVINNEPSAHNETQLEWLYTVIEGGIKQIFSFVTTANDFPKKAYRKLQDLLFLLELVCCDYRTRALYRYVMSILQMLLAPQKVIKRKLTTKDYAYLYSLSEFCECFERIVHMAGYYWNTTLDDTCITEFFSHIPDRETEINFSLMLYPLLSTKQKRQLSICADSCNCKELYRGISSGYFLFKKGTPAYEQLMRLCRTQKSMTGLADINNPAYVLWLLYLDGFIPSVIQYKGIIETLFYR